MRLKCEKMVRLYLDNCAFNRPFDEQSHIRVRLESEAKLYVQRSIKEKKTELAWSYILNIENDQNPFKEKRNAIANWKSLAVVDVEETAPLKERADRLLKKRSEITEIRLVNPIEIAEMINDNNH